MLLPLIDDPALQDWRGQVRVLATLVALATLTRTFWRSTKMIYEPGIALWEDDQNLQFTGRSFFGPKVGRAASEHSEVLVAHRFVVGDEGPVLVDVRLAVGGTLVHRVLDGGH